jgi:hypothetical protein
MGSAMNIDVLYFEGCPNSIPTLRRVKEVMDRLGICVKVNAVEVTEGDDPAALKFVGSPTVLIDGRDIDPSQRGQANYAFGCRVFGGAGVPPAEMIEAAISEALARAGKKVTNRRAKP